MKCCRRRLTSKPPRRAASDTRRWPMAPPSIDATATRQPSAPGGAAMPRVAACGDERARDAALRQHRGRFVRGKALRDPADVQLHAGATEPHGPARVVQLQLLAPDQRPRGCDARSRSGGVCCRRASRQRRLSGPGGDVEGAVARARQRCAARRTRNRSSLTGTGRPAGLPRHLHQLAGLAVVAQRLVERARCARRRASAPALAMALDPGAYRTSRTRVPMCGSANSKRCSTATAPRIENGVAISDRRRRHSAKQP